MGVNGNFKPTKPLPYQKAGVLALERFNGRGWLADEMGLGKTLQALWFARRRGRWPMVVVCPAALKANWRREARTHMNWSARILGGTEPPAALGDDYLYVINYDVLNAAWVRWFRGIRPAVLVLDEAHAVKNRAAKRTKIVRQLAAGVESVLALSGTPLLNRPAELYATLNLLRPDLFSSRVAFEERYCQRRLTPWGWTATGAKNLTELNKIMTKNLMIRRTKAEVMAELPAKSRHVVNLQMTRPVIYRALETEYRALSKSLFRMKKQRANVIALQRFGDMSRTAVELKMPAVVEWIDRFLESGRKLVIFGIHRRFVEQLYARYRERAVLLYGATKPDHRDLAVTEFQKNPKIRLFVGNLQAAGAGVNLTAGTAVAFFEMGFNPALHQQAEARIHRIGQTAETEVFYLLAADTIETKMAELIEKKQAIANEAIDGRKTGRDDISLVGELTRVLWGRK